MDIYKPIRDGPDSKLLLVWSYVENLMPLISLRLLWMPSGYRKTEIRGNDLSGSWHWQAVMSGDSVIE
jgi:hypothetical protein